MGFTTNPIITGVNNFNAVSGKANNITIVGGVDATSNPAFSAYFLGESLPGSISFSRSTNATMFDSQGRLVWAPAQLFAASNDMANATLWTPLGTVPATVTSGQADPIGGNTAFLLDVSGFVDSRVAQDLTSTKTPAGGNVVFSVWIKTYPGDSPGTFPVRFRRKDGSSLPTLLTATDTWTRVFVTYDLLAGATSTVVWIADRGSGGTLTRCLMWRPMICLGDNPPTYIENTSTVATSAVYGPRFDYDPLTLAARGLLIEETRANLQPISQGTGANWTVNFCSVTDSGATIQGNPALTFTTTSTGSVQFCFPNLAAPVLTASTVYTASVRVKRGNHPRVQFTVSNNHFLPAVADALVNYNFDTDTLVVSGSSLPTPTATRQLCVDGSIILSLTYTTGTAPTSGASGLVLAVDTDNAVRLAGTGTNGATIHFLGVQLEQGVFASSYIPTYGTGATRAGDVLDLVSDLPYSAAGTSLYASFMRYGIPAASTTTAFCFFGDATTNIAGNFGFGTPAQQRIDLVNASVQEAALTVGDGVVNTVYKMAVRFAPNDTRLSQNGTLTGTDTTVNMPASLPTTRKALGRANQVNTQQMCGWLREFSVYTTPLTDAQLQALTS